MSESLFIYLAFAIGGVAVAIGLLAMLFPQKMSEGFGLPIAGPGIHYVRALGVRDVFVGIVVLICGGSHQWTQLGYVCLAIALVAASDFYTVFNYGERKASMAHMAGFILSLISSLLFFS